MTIHGLPPPIVITSTDYERLWNLTQARHTPLADYLAEELERARIVEGEQVPPTTVTMHSRFIFTDGLTGETRTVSLVYPPEENIDDGRISILTPIGAALLGLSEGQSIECETLSGVKRTLTLVKVLSQPASTPARAS